MKMTWRGVYPAATTQFKSDESVDFAATMKHLDAMIAAGVNGMIMLGTVGENYGLEYAEKLEMLRETVKHIGSRVPVLTGVAETTTRGACRFAADAAKIGVNGLMVLPALVYKSDTRENVHHFRAVAKASDLPIMIYNNPVSYGVDLKPETLLELADEKHFEAVKESSNDPRRITDIKNVCGDRYHLLCGVDDLVYESYMLAVRGWVSGLVNAFPAENRLLWDLLEAGKYEEALKVYQWYTPLLHLDTYIKLVQYIKLANTECGFGTELCRALRLNLAGAEREQILGIIRKAKATRPKP